MNANCYFSCVQSRWKGPQRGVGGSWWELAFLLDREGMSLRWQGFGATRIWEMVTDYTL